MEFEDKTIAGYPVRIYAPDGAGPYPIHGAVDVNGNGFITHYWTEEGVSGIHGKPNIVSGYNLIPVRPSTHTAQAGNTQGDLNG
jgi:hypothetical protein